MVLTIESKKQAQGWHVEVRDVPGTASLGPTVDVALAEALRKLADVTADHHFKLPMDVLIAETAPAGLPVFTGADLRTLWGSLSHGDDGLADAVERAAHEQPGIADEPSPWEP